MKGGNEARQDSTDKPGGFGKSAVIIHSSTKRNKLSEGRSELQVLFEPVYAHPSQQTMIRLGSFLASAIIKIYSSPIKRNGMRKFVEGDWTEIRVTAGFALFYKLKEVFALRFEEATL